VTPAARRWLGIAARVLPAADRAWLLDELEQLWAHRAERHGESGADAALRREVMRFVGLRLQDPLRRRIGNVGGWMGDTTRELKMALRSLTRAPGFATVAVLTLGIGIGANAVVFGLVDGVLLEDLPYPDSDRIVRVWDGTTGPAAEYDYYDANAATLMRIGGYSAGVGVNLGGEAEPLRLIGSRVTRSFLEILGSPLAMGGGFSDSADRVGGSDEVIVSHALWSTEFGRDPGILGRELVLDGAPHTVVGVLPDDHAFPAGSDDLLLPLRIDRTAAQLGTYWGDYSIRMIGRLAPGSDTDAAVQELRAFSGGPLIENNPIWTPIDNYRSEGTISPLHEALVGDVRGRLWLLVGVVSVVLIVVAANVGNLLLARGLARRKDMAVRAALGAGRGRLVRTQLAEGLVLAGAGTLVGLVLAALTIEILRPVLADTLPRVAGVSLDLRVLGVTAVVAGLVGLSAGAIAALRGVDGSPGLLLRSADRGSAGSRQRLSRALVVAQVAAAVVLVVGAGLLTRDLGELGRIDPAFDSDRLITARIDVTLSSFASPDEGLVALEALERRVSSSPDLVHAALASSIPFDGVPNAVASYIEGVTPDPNALTVFAKQSVSAGYFEAMGIELIEGRLPTEADVAGSEPVALVDESAVAEVWGGRSPLGDFIQNYGPYGEGGYVIGVVSSVRREPIVDDPRPTWYEVLAQAPGGTTVYVVAEPRGRAAAGWNAIRSAVAEVVPGAPVTELLRYDARISDEHAQTRFLVGVLGAFAAVTLLLGSLGVYGVTAYSVRQRLREFGVRVALGASSEGLRWRVVREGLVLAGVGAAIGVLLAIPAVRALDAFLVRVAPLDLAAFGAVPVVMIVATVVAVYVPARRATRIDPAEALRGD
jgi:predicted permease